MQPVALRLAQRKEVFEPLVGEPFTKKPTKNLLYFVWANGSDMVNWNINQLKKRWHLFDGKKVIGVTYSKPTDVDSVIRQFPRDVTVLTAENNRKLGEMALFFDLLEQVKTIDPNQVTFYAHAKGVKYLTHPKLPAIKQWAKEMYETLLDYPGWSVSNLDKFAMSGTFMHESSMRAFRVASHWHFSGTFYWFRNIEVFSKTWNETMPGYYGSEIWAGVMFDKSQVQTAIDSIRPRDFRALSNPKSWESSLGSKLKKWKHEHRQYYIKPVSTKNLADNY